MLSVNTSWQTLCIDCRHKEKAHIWPVKKINAVHTLYWELSVRAGMQMQRSQIYQWALEVPGLRRCSFANSLGYFQLCYISKVVFLRSDRTSKVLNMLHQHLEITLESSETWRGAKVSGTVPDSRGHVWSTCQEEQKRHLLWTGVRD